MVRYLFYTIGDLTYQSPLVWRAFPVVIAGSPHSINLKCGVRIINNLSHFLRSSTKFLGEFAKLRKATISLVMSVRPSVRMEQIDSHRSDLHEIWRLWIFRKSVEKIQVSLHSDKNQGYVATTTNRHFLSLTIQNYQSDALNIIYSSNIITLLYMFRVSSTHLQEFSL